MLGVPSMICPACGEVSTVRCDLLDSGTVLRCEECAREVVVDIHTPEFRASIYGFAPATARQKQTAPGSEAVLPVVIGDLRMRAREGDKRYGHPLRTFNGRDSLIDAYQEAIDLVMYLRQHLMERTRLMSFLESILSLARSGGSDLVSARKALEDIATIVSRAIMAAQRPKDCDHPEELPRR